jgi:single stranded DNA-binding protein
MRNLLILVGNLTKDVEHKQINGKDFVQFDIGVYKRPNESFFVRVKAWESIAKLMIDLKKGDRIQVSGKLDIESWDNAEGKKQYKTTCIANNFEILVRRNYNVNDKTYGIEYGIEEEVEF